jgi:hypothetical protein
MTRQGRSSPSCQRGSRTALRRSPGVFPTATGASGTGGRIARRPTPDLVTTSRFSAIRPEVHGVSAEEQASLDGYSAFSPPLERGAWWVMGRLEAEEVESLRSDNDGRARRAGAMSCPASDRAPQRRQTAHPRAVLTTPGGGAPLGPPAPGSRAPIPPPPSRPRPRSTSPVSPCSKPLRRREHSRDSRLLAEPSLRCLWRGFNP